MFHHPSINQSYSEFQRLLHDLNLNPHQFNMIMEHLCYLLRSMDELFVRIDCVFDEHEGMCQLVDSNKTLTKREQMIVKTHLTRVFALTQACLNQEFTTPVKIPLSYYHKNKEAYNQKKEANNLMCEAAKQLMMIIIERKYPNLPKPNPEANRLN